MIAVIADDLSGAAELANASIEAGYSAEVQLRFCAETDADVVCVDTETRSLAPEAAAAIAGEVARTIAAARPTLVYKKCDSVLRGAVAAESLAIAGAFKKKRVLLIPANPSRRRVIRGGKYFVDGVPLSQTAFAHDPEHPRNSSIVAELLGHAPGIATPDVSSREDLDRLAATVDLETLPAGGVDFFSALLEKSIRPQKTIGAASISTLAEGGLSLFVCGSDTAWRAGRGETCVQKQVPVFPMPHELFAREFQEDFLVRWAILAATGLCERRAAMLAIGGEEPAPGVTPAMLAGRLAQTVDLIVAELILAENPVASVFLEGGATAAAVVRQLGFQRFHAEPSPGPGVGALRPVGNHGPMFFVKPGSYPWPETVWRADAGTF